VRLAALPSLVQLSQLAEFTAPDPAALRIELDPDAEAAWSLDGKQCFNT
jgi:hypothetical protein